MQASSENLVFAVLGFTNVILACEELSVYQKASPLQACTLQADCMAEQAPAVV